MIYARKKIKNAKPLHICKKSSTFVRDLSEYADATTQIHTANVMAGNADDELCNDGRIEVLLSYR